MRQSFTCFSGQSAEAFLALLGRDPHALLGELREMRPIAWVEPLQMWYLTRYADVRRCLLDSDGFTTSWAQSTIFDTFGANMLTTEGPIHDRYRAAASPAFMPSRIRIGLEAAIQRAASALAAPFQTADVVELRAAFASRLPIQVILLAFGLPLDGEQRVRRWYDHFEAALGNFAGDAAISLAAQRSVREFQAYIDAAIAEVRAGGDAATLLGQLVHAPSDGRLTDEEIWRNLLIIFFGGISTVEALILNTVWALMNHPEALRKVRDVPESLPRVLDEVMRWLSPVQSATRHATRDMELEGVVIRKGEVVNCMLAAANRDPRVFKDPDAFLPERTNADAHLGFATGTHMCIGFRLAKVEARIAIATLFDVLPEPELVMMATTPPEGHEFFQPRLLTLRSGAVACQ